MQASTELANGSTNIYNQQLRYYNPVKGTAPLYTGNISEWSTTMADHQTNTYGFGYDKFGRLSSIDYYAGAVSSPSPTFTERNITYDKNGNIQTLQRYAQNTASPADSYTYSYEGNTLASISGTDNNASISGVQYSYDANGNMIHDGLKNLELSYNLLNLPSVVSQAGNEKATYSWFADGSKYSVLDNSNNGYYYIGSLIYASNNGNLQIESTAFAGGRINLATSTGGALTQDIQYHHTDHLGSVRAITNQSGETIEQNAYYPFGCRHTFGNTYAQTTNRFKYNGKEEQTTGNLQYLDYGARMYDSKVARWFVQDPLSEKYYAHSPYNYCVNNPVMFVDPDGNSVYTKVAKAVFKLGKTVYKNGIKTLAQTSSYAEAFADVIDDVNTLFDKEASGAERILAFGSLLSEISPVSINDIKDGVAIAKRVHANSKLSTKAQHAYDILDREDEKIVKTGVSSGGKRVKDSKSIRAEKQVRELNKKAEREKYESTITYEVPEGDGARDKIYKYERERAIMLRDSGHLDENIHKKP